MSGCCLWCQHLIMSLLVTTGSVTTSFYSVIDKYVFKMTEKN